MGISLTFARLSPSGGQVGYALLTRAPVDAYRKQASNIVSPRLACVKPVASVHPEPGSNSRLKSFFLITSAMRIYFVFIDGCTLRTTIFGSYMYCLFFNVLVTILRLY